MSGIAPQDGTWVDFCHLDPASTASDPLEIRDWLARHGIRYRHRDGPAGNTMFLVAQADHARAVELWAEQRSSAEWILSRLGPAASPPKRTTDPGTRFERNRGRS